MTNTEIKNNIQTHVVDKTLAKSISNIELGNDVKSVVDYVDQEVKVRILKTTITEAQILQLFTTPITILDSSGTGNIKYPINVYIKRNAGTVYTLANNFANVINDLNNSLEKELQLATVLGQATTGMSSSPISNSQHIFYANRNSYYKLKAAVGNPTGGTGSIDVYVTYIEITL